MLNRVLSGASSCTDDAIGVLERHIQEGLGLAWWDVNLPYTESCVPLRTQPSRRRLARGRLLNADGNLLRNVFSIFDAPGPDATRKPHHSLRQLLERGYHRDGGVSISPIDSRTKQQRLCPCLPSHFPLSDQLPLLHQTMQCDSIFGDNKRW